MCVFNAPMYSISALLWFCVKELLKLGCRCSVKPRAAHTKHLTHVVESVKHTREYFMQFCNKSVWDHVAQYITNHENIPPGKTHDPFPSQQRECSQRLNVKHNEDQHTSVGMMYKNREATEMKRVGLINTMMPHDFEF